MPFSVSSLRHACRSLARRPVFASLSLLLLSLAAAAVTAIFAIVNATLLRPLPFRDPSGLVAIGTTEPVTRDSAQDVVAGPMQLFKWRSQSRTLVTVEGYTPLTMDLTGDADPEALRGAAISAGMFDMLGTPPALGRSFSREEETPTSGVVVISNSVAQRKFGSAATALGKQLNLDAMPRTVVGVMPPGYSLLFQGGDVWIPLDLTVEQQAKTKLRMVATFGRLRPRVSPQQAFADLASIQNTLRDEQPDAFRSTGIKVIPLREFLFGSQRASLYVLSAALVLVLLIAGANVGNLTIADVVARRISTMTRLAMGASRTSIVKLRVVETGLLAVAALVIGVAIAYAALAGFMAIDERPFLALGTHWIDGTVILVTIVAISLVAAAATLPVAVAEARVNIGAIASAAAKSVGAKTERRLRHTLASIQVAITVVLLCGAALLGRDFLRLLKTSPGFRTSGVAVVVFNIANRAHPTLESRAQYVDALVHAVRSVPGVENASTIQTRFVINESMQSSFDIEGKPETPGVQQFAQIRHVMPDVFSVLGIRVIQGRGLDSTDRANGRLVAVVSSSFARSYWPGENAIGKRLRRAGRSAAEWLDVVGVVDDIMDAGAGVPLGPMVFVPYLQQNTVTARVSIVAKTRMPPGTLGPSIRRAIWSVNRNQAIDEIVSLDDLMSRTASQPRFQTLVVAAFGVASLLLVLAGVYALTLFGVLGRMRELGVRAALGATPGQVTSLAMCGSMAPVFIGVVGGGLIAVPTTRLMQRVIHTSLESGDALVIAAVVALLVTAATLAALLPARRAGQVAPSEALR